MPKKHSQNADSRSLERNRSKSAKPSPMSLLNADLRENNENTENANDPELPEFVHNAAVSSQPLIQNSNSTNAENPITSFGSQIPQSLHTEPTYTADTEVISPYSSTSKKNKGSVSKRKAREYTDILIRNCPRKRTRYNKNLPTEVIRATGSDKNLQSNNSLNDIDCTISKRCSIYKNANRIMYSICSNNAEDITRMTLEYRDSQYIVKHEVDKTTNKSRPVPATLGSSILSWPQTGIQDYLSSANLDSYSHMGINPLDVINPKSEYISLEEPAGEWEVQQLRKLENCDRDDSISSIDEGSSSEDNDEEDEEYDEPFSSISDTNRNGGISLIVKRSQVQSEDRLFFDDDVQFVTKFDYLRSKQQKYAGVNMDRLEYAYGPGKALQSHYRPLVEATRAIVINQVLSQNAKAAGHRIEGSSNTPTTRTPQDTLSKYVSTVVAIDAVEKIEKIWSTLRDVCRDLSKSEIFTQLPLPATKRGGWTTILNAAVLAGLPEEVISRSYRRLAKLCDHPSEQRVKPMFNAGFRCYITKRIIKDNKNYTSKEPAEDQDRSKTPE